MHVVQIWHINLIKNSRTALDSGGRAGRLARMMQQRLILSALWTSRWKSLIPVNTRINAHPGFPENSPRAVSDFTFFILGNSCYWRLLTTCLRVWLYIRVNDSVLQWQLIDRVANSDSADLWHRDSHSRLARAGNAVDYTAVDLLSELIGFSSTRFWGSANSKA